jgi:hypothetical protein
MREPIAAPKTTKYSDVEMTGETMLWRTVRKVRAISNLYIARTAYKFIVPP